MAGLKTGTQVIARNRSGQAIFAFETVEQARAWLGRTKFRRDLGLRFYRQNVTEEEVNLD